ncbi:MAG TPA: maleylpyruvate isomerase family mycothiol-dependent enzyme [Nocardioides sp.]|nr:maleylpyruvate isomerase family mycothiol-dependent enzyme [Nocardioides sp.]
MNPIEAVLDATDRCLSTIDALTDEQLRGPSGLPGWSRGHVVAHIGGHAHGSARALRGLRTGGPVAVYDSQEARDAEVEARSGAPAAELASYVQLGCLRLAGELRLMKAVGEVERVPGGPRFTIPELVEARWREVEVHHADLDAGYRPADWPTAFAAYLLEDVAEQRGKELDLTLHARDLEKTVLVGRGGHGVAGTAADLAWWLTGRGDGEGLTSTRPLPTLGAWR